ncbi:MAG TPA: cytochrome c1 [Burkholderiales bacterium]|jgi:ubiquinol-cytochrome c reductase cytochrome c1 subunit|nr:cytochrome c1 [Burkholderiales bacterium]
MLIMKAMRAVVLLCCVVVPALAFAAETELTLDHAPVDAHDTESLQRGARTFVNYCLNCHSANYMRYNRLRDIGLTEQQIRDNLIFTDAKVGDLMKIAADPKDTKQWFGAPPPDLTVIARSRSSHAGPGSDWLYTYLRTFYRDPSRPTGWNNVVYPNVGMPHALWQLQGEQVMKETQAPGPGYMRTVQQLALDKPGTLKPVEFDQLVADLVNYMTYMSEPARDDRITVGLYALIVISILIALTYALKKEFWKDVH